MHDIVRAALKDPESARFGETVVHASGVACGVVSSRNTLGGMVADMPFMLWGDELFMSDDAGERRVVVDCCIEVMRAAQSRRELDHGGKAACQGLPAGVPVSVLK